MKRKALAPVAISLALSVAFAGGWLAHEPSSAPPSTPLHRLVVVPDVLALKYLDAKSALQKDGLYIVGHGQAEPTHPAVALTVIREMPAAGTTVPMGTAVGVVVAAPSA